MPILLLVVPQSQAEGDNVTREVRAIQSHHGSGWHSMLSIHRPQAYFSRWECYVLLQGVIIAYLPTYQPTSSSRTPPADTLDAPKQTLVPDSPLTVRRLEQYRERGRRWYYKLRALPASYATRMGLNLEVVYELLCFVGKLRAKQDEEVEPPTSHRVHSPPRPLERTAALRLHRKRLRVGYGLFYSRYKWPFYEACIGLAKKGCMLCSHNK